jgi:L-amino acid N-acyltransferase YncA
MGWFEDKSAHGYPVIVAEREGEVVGYGVLVPFASVRVTTTLSNTASTLHNHIAAKELANKYLSI